MEADFRKIGLRHLQDKARISHEHIAALAVGGHELMLALLEILKRQRIIALYPASLVHRHRLPAALRAILMEESVLNHLELQLSDRTDDFTAIELMDKQLGHALVHKLVYSLFKLLALHGVGILDIHEHFRREAR